MEKTFLTNINWYAFLNNFVTLSDFEEKLSTLRKKNLSFQKNLTFLNVLRNLTISVAFYGKFATIYWKKITFRKCPISHRTSGSFARHWVKDTLFEWILFLPYFKYGRKRIIFRKRFSDIIFEIGPRYIFQIYKFRFGRFLSCFAGVRITWTCFDFQFFQFIRHVFPRDIRCFDLFFPTKQLVTENYRSHCPLLFRFRGSFSTKPNLCEVIYFPGLQLPKRPH